MNKHTFMVTIARS